MIDPSFIFLTILPFPLIILLTSIEELACDSMLGLTIS